MSICCIIFPTQIFHILRRNDHLSFHGFCYLVFNVMMNVMEMAVDTCICSNSNINLCEVMEQYKLFDFNSKGY